MNLDNIELVKALIKESDEIKSTLNELADIPVEDMGITVWRKSKVAVGAGAVTMLGRISQREFMVCFRRLLEDRYATIGEKLEKL